MLVSLKCFEVQNILKSRFESSKNNKVGVATLSIAYVIKRLGVDRSIKDLSKAIHKRCHSYVLLKKWLAYLVSFRMMLFMTGKYSVKKNKIWNKLHLQRKLFVRNFLKTLWHCGKIKNSKTAMKKIVNAFFGTLACSHEKLFKFVGKLKALFFKKNKENSDKSIYPGYLRRRIARVKVMIKNCIESKKKCAKKCGKKTKKICKKARKGRKRIVKKVRIIFSKQFAKLFVKFIKSIRISGVKISIKNLIIPNVKKSKYQKSKE